MTDFDSVDFFSDQSLVPHPYPYSTTSAASARCRANPLMG